METKLCLRCEGTGKHVREAFTFEGKSYPRHVSQCPFCKGVPNVAKPDAVAIRAACLGRKGLRSAKPKDNDAAYYVWRMARFHGGVDMTMPVMAGLAVYGNPWRAELDAMADALAKEFYGTDLAAAKRWSRAMGGY